MNRETERERRRIKKEQEKGRKQRKIQKNDSEKLEDSEGKKRTE